MRVEDRDFSDIEVDQEVAGKADCKLDELAGQVDAVRRRLDDHNAILHRNHTAMTSLAESVGKVVAHQRRRERGLNLNSFVAYTLFTVLLGGGFFMLYNDRAVAIEDTRDRAVADREAAMDEVRALESELAARDRAAAHALQYYELLRAQRYAEVVARYGEIEDQRLTPTEAALFANGVAQAKSEIANAGYLAGLDAFRAGDTDKAAAELRTALAYEDAGPRVAEMRYYLGVTQYKRGDHEAAVRQLELAIAGRVEQSGGADARYYLAAALESLNDFERARAEYERFASSHPRLPLTITARRRAALLTRRAVPTN